MLHYPYIPTGCACTETTSTTLPGESPSYEELLHKRGCPGEDYRGQPHVLYIYKSVFLSHHFDSLHRTVGHDGTYHIDTASQRRNIEAIDIPVQYQCPRKVINRKRCSFGSI